MFSLQSSRFKMLPLSKTFMVDTTITTRSLKHILPRSSSSSLAFSLNNVNNDINICNTTKNNKVYINNHTNRRSFHTSFLRTSKDDAGDIPSHGHYPGDVVLPFTHELNIKSPENYEKFPVYRVTEDDGSIRHGQAEPDCDEEKATKMYRTMARLQAMDLIFYNAQRQGRISFYMTSNGEEAIHIGSSAALELKDTVFAQYREQGVLMWRGFTLENFADQCFSNKGDLGKGRQMPVHYGSADLNYQTISSPLATQVPQAVGAAYANKRLKDNDACVICYFGDGSASEGDFHAGLNFSATLEAPIIFFCRNNGYAISTPTVDQYRGDGIISRAAGYGIHAIRVDGNDLWAVYNATKAAREIAVKENKPVLIEAMSYRVGHHSTSDDSTRYRKLEEIQHWQDTNEPLTRFRKYMEKRGWWDEEKENQMRDEERMKVLQALEKAEMKEAPDVDSLFEDVYAEKLPHLLEQEKWLKEHLAKYPEEYKSGGKG